MDKQEQAKNLISHFIMRGDHKGLSEFLEFADLKLGASDLCAAVQRASQFGVDGIDGIGRMRVVCLVLDKMSFDAVARDMTGRLIKGIDGEVGRLGACDLEVINVDTRISSLRSVQSQLRLALQ